MSKVGSWSVTPGNNNSTPPDGFPENQLPSTLNDGMRQLMADVRTLIADLQYVDLNNTPSYLTATTFSMGTADIVNFHVGRRVKLFDATMLYGTIDSVSSTFVSVRLDAGALTASLSSVAMSVITQQNNSMPDMSWKRRNMLINGAMDIWQRGSSFSPSNNSKTYTADRYYWLQSASCAVNVTRAERSETATNVPTIAQAGQLFTSSLRISISAADAAMAAGEYGILGYRMEGYDWRQIAHKPNILTFWTSSNRSGIYSVALRNHPASVSYVNTFTLSAVNTWTRFAFTIPEAPTTVTWNYSQSTGLQISFCLGAGANWQGVAGNWTATEVVATSAQANFLGSAGNVFMITGIDLKEGTQIVPSDPPIYADELSRSQRYYNGQLTHITVDPGEGNPQPKKTLNYPTMRAAPAIGTSVLSNAGITTLITVTDITTSGFRYYGIFDTTNLTVYNVSADAEL